MFTTLFDNASEAIGTVGFVGTDRGTQGQPFVHAWIVTGIGRAGCVSIRTRRTGKASHGYTGAFRRRLPFTPFQSTGKSFGTVLGRSTGAGAVPSHAGLTARTLSRVFENLTWACGTEVDAAIDRPVGTESNLRPRLTQVHPTTIEFEGITAICGRTVSIDVTGRSAHEVCRQIRCPLTLVDTLAAK